MIEQPVEYGVSTKLFVVSKKTCDETLVLCGNYEHGRWTRVLSARSAHALWLYLTRIFFLEHAREVLSIVTTAPLRGIDRPTITTDVQISATDDGMVKLIGTTTKNKQWTALLSAQEARRLWKALDQTLYPFGWEGANYIATAH